MLNQIYFQREENELIIPQFSALQADCTEHWK